ncbi:MAG: nitroreductase [Nannocystis sp.]|uniref:nitroreductase family protein n=1 Tax=Nannocystis sp. TaxID=1962667 RepID=UPI002425D8EA|nr:nitroreductase [Nannocystis sp.]MBK9758215.1 nitroreductase [Nannocystis sp.]
MSPHASLLDAILQRRSAAGLSPPGPTPQQFELLLRAATTVPDHGMLQPYRFVLVADEARARLGDALADAAREARPDLSAGLLEKARRKPFAAPALIVLIAAPRADSPIPEWEQLASAACTGYAIVLTAHALGLGAAWKTAAVLEGAALRDTLALQPGERLLGWVLLGQADPQARPRPVVDLRRVVGELTQDGLQPYLPPAD